MQMAYNGSHAFVEVPDLGATVERGEPIEIPSMSLAKRLYRQGWSLVKNDDNNDDNGKGDS